jgi:hypothetical protein
MHANAIRGGGFTFGFYFLAKASGACGADVTGKASVVSNLTLAASTVGDP